MYRMEEIECLLEIAGRSSKRHEKARAKYHRRLHMENTRAYAKSLSEYNLVIKVRKKLW
jgi:hypothetical protein